MGLKNEELTGSVIDAAIESTGHLGVDAGVGLREQPRRRAYGAGYRLRELKAVIASQWPYHDFLASWLP